jgi:hypothetical protein
MDVDRVVLVKCLIMDQYFGAVWTIDEKVLGKWRSVVRRVVSALRIAILPSALRRVGFPRPYLASLRFCRFAAS